MYLLFYLCATYNTLTIYTVNTHPKRSVKKGAMAETTSGPQGELPLGDSAETTHSPQTEPSVGETAASTVGTTDGICGEGDRSKKEGRAAASSAGPSREPDDQRIMPTPTTAPTTTTAPPATPVPLHLYHTDPSS
jgi:hypothetical protein